MQLFTIGHSSHPINEFTRLLESQGIKMLVDVRTSPYSKFSPQFNKEMLEHYLHIQRIKYVYLGKELGGRPSDATCYKSRSLPTGEIDYLHEVDYPEVMKKTWFQDGIHKLLELAKTSKLAIMCSEEDPAACHRHHLITKFLLVEHPEISVTHIRGDGKTFNAKTLLTSVGEENTEQLTLFPG